MPKYDELSIKSLFDKFKGDAKVTVYLPDRLPKGRLPDRSYFFNVLHSVHPQYVKQMIRVAQDNRHKVSQKSLDDGVIRVSDDWWKKLNEVPFSSGKYIP